MTSNLLMYFYNIYSINHRGFNRDAENDKIEFKLRAPVLSLVGNYKISGRVLVLPIQGNGRSNMTMGK